MTDPRIAVIPPRERHIAGCYLEEFDTADRLAGVVRVDTRDPATIEHAARTLHFEYHADEGDIHWHGCSTCNDRARIVLAALTEATP